MNRVIHFELGAEQPERAAKFYGDAFGWKFEKWAGPVDYWLIMTGPSDQPGIDGGMSSRREQSENAVNTIDVASEPEN